jgi:hypothetical protein
LLNTPSKPTAAVCRERWRDDLWDRCYRELMANADIRLVQEVTRLGGHYAHVHDEAIEAEHDDAAVRRGSMASSARCCIVGR